jgi:diadenosine tetraphosphate (Ap4A) HIT family hydrolase
MVVTYRHIAWLDDADPGELTEMIGAARQCEQALRRVYRPDGFNVGSISAPVPEPGLQVTCICMWSPAGQGMRILSP